MMWRGVYVHEEIITAERYVSPRDGPVPHHIIADHVTSTEDGDPISEWEISVADVRAFVERRQRRRARRGL